VDERDERVPHDVLLARLGLEHGDDRQISHEVSSSEFWSRTVGRG
jgi:hypothetical protein